MAAIPGSVRVTGIIAPTDDTDTYAVTDTVYGLDGLRNFSGDSTTLSGITAQRRRAGMIAGTVSGGTRLYYRLNDSPWSFNESDWTLLTLYDYTGSTDFVTSGSNWQQSITQGNVVTTGQPTLSGDSMLFSNSAGNSQYKVSAEDTLTFYISATTGGGHLLVDPKFLEYRRNGNNATFRTNIDSSTGAVGIRGTFASSIYGELHLTSAVTDTRNWSMPDKSGVVALTSDLTGFTSGEASYWVSGLTPTSLKYANSPASTVSGDYAFLNGESNYAVGTYATVLNGAGNVASGDSYSIVINGDSNFARANGAVVINGESNQANNSHSVVLGGVANIVDGQHALTHGLNNRVYGDYAQAFGTNNIARGQNQFVVGEYNVSGGTSGGTVQTDHIFIVGAGSPQERKNALALTREGMLQMNPFTASTLPTVNVSDGAIAYSANTGLYQYVNGAWTGFTSGSGGGGSQTWQETITQGNIVTTGLPTLSGTSLVVRQETGGPEWNVLANSNLFRISGNTGSGFSLDIEAKYIGFQRTSDASYARLGNESSSQAQLTLSNGTNYATFELTHLISGNRTWQMPDQSGVVALVTDLTGNTGGAPQTLACLNPTTTWNLDLGHNAAITLTANTTFSITNATAGDYGTVVVTQDATGGRSITPPGSSVVVNGAGGVLNLTSNANAVDVLTFYYDGTTYYWNLGGDYT